MHIFDGAPGVSASTITVTDWRAETHMYGVGFRLEAKCPPAERCCLRHYLRRIGVLLPT